MGNGRPVRWFDVREWGVEGKGWSQVERYFDRLPRYAQARVPRAVWDLSHHSTGMCAFFETNSRQLCARWTLFAEPLALPHMPATGASGLDLYGRDEAGNWRWLAVGHPEALPATDATLIYGLDGRPHAYALYLPLFNGVETIEVGVETDAQFTPILPRAEAPLVFYGTSILQGIAASRPGACHAAILGRKLGRPVINLGFAGKGTMDLALAGLLAELPACVYVVDCLPNMGPELVAERAGPFLQGLRRARPEVPLVVVEDRDYANAWAVSALRARNLASRKHLRAAFRDLEGAPGAQLRYVTGDQLLGGDDEASVDGSHPTDLGFARYAERIYPELAGVL